MSRLVMKDGLQQATLFWKDEESGIDCKGRLDHYPDKQNVIVDLKFCNQIDRFHNQIWDLRYFIQAGHYTNGAIDNDLEVDAFYFIAFCFGSPPSIRVCSLSQGVLEFGKDVAKNTLRLIKEYQEAKKWPEHNIPIETVSLAKILGMKSDIPNQLEPYDLVEEITLPRRKW